VLCVGEGPPTGLAILRIVADEVELLRIGVAPSARRAGVGRALLEQGLAWAGRRHAAQVHLEVERDNIAARALYARLGFREVGMRRGYFGPGRDALLFTLELGADR
jgi:ribosomal-protein-alanine N-acetyltransferase